MPTCPDAHAAIGKLRHDLGELNAFPARAYPNITARKGGTEQLHAEDHPEQSDERVSPCSGPNPGLGSEGIDEGRDPRAEPKDPAVTYNSDGDGQLCRHDRRCFRVPLTGRADPTTPA